MSPWESGGAIGKLLSGNHVCGVGVGVAVGVAVGVGGGGVGLGVKVAVGLAVGTAVDVTAILATSTEGVDGFILGSHPKDPKINKTNIANTTTAIALTPFDQGSGCICLVLRISHLPAPIK